MIGFDSIEKFGKGYREFRNREIPLHYLLYHERGPGGEPGFGITVLDLGLFAWGPTEGDARAAIEAHIDDFLGNSDTSMDSIDNILASTGMEKFWALYRRLALYYGNPDPTKRRLSTTIEELQTLQRENQELRAAVDVILPKLLEDQREQAEQITEIRVTLDGIQSMFVDQERGTGVP